MVFGQVDARGEQIEGHVGRLVYAMVDPECLRTFDEPIGSFERAIYHWTADYGPISVTPIERHMHHQVEHPERLERFCWSPRHGEAGARNETLNKVRQF